MAGICGEMGGETIAFEFQTMPDEVKEDWKQVEGWMAEEKKALLCKTIRVCGGEVWRTKGGINEENAAVLQGLDYLRRRRGRVLIRRN